MELFRIESNREPFSKSTHKHEYNNEQQQQQEQKMSVFNERLEMHCYNFIIHSRVCVFIVCLRTNESLCKMNAKPNQTEVNSKRLI